MSRSILRVVLICALITVATAIEGHRVQVRSLDAVDGTPDIDIKPVLAEDVRER
jgi:tRNA (Thr-GGU) A37 N-methylase